MDMDIDGRDVLAGRYELGALIGRGGMADVHRASDLLLDRAVALKVLRDPAGDGAESARFVAEARTLAGLDHRGLVTLLDAGVDSERPFLVMELVDGPTLSTLIARRELSPEAVADHGAQVAEALGYVHSRGVLHRDVKPGNVLVGTDGRVKLADFGIARIVGDTVRHTRTGEVVGTVAYIAPEQVLGEELTSAVDVYSLGLVLLEALTGERAFPGSDTEAALARLHRAPVVPDWLPAGWRRLLAAMTDRDPAQRPGAEAAAVRLRELAAAPVAERTAAMEVPTRRIAAPVIPPVLVADETVAVGFGPWSRSSRTLLVAAAAGVVLALAVLLTTLARGGSAPSRPAGDVAPLSSPTTDASPTTASSLPSPSSTPSDRVTPAAKVSTVAAAPAATKHPGHPRKAPGAKGPGGKGPEGKGPGQQGPGQGPGGNGPGRGRGPRQVVEAHHRPEAGQQIGQLVLAP